MIPKKIEFLWMLLILFCWLKAPADGQEYNAVFDEVVELIENNFYDRQKLGNSWQDLVQAHRKKIESTTSRIQLERTINDLLAELDASHTRFFGIHNPKRYQLLGVFHQLYDPDRKDLFVYKGIGIATTRVNEKYLIESVFDGFPAKQAGLQYGDEIVSVDDQPFEPILSFENCRQSFVSVKIRRHNNLHTVDCDVVALDGRTMFEKALRESCTQISIDGRKIAYLHAWSYAGIKYQEIIRDQLLWGDLSKCDGLILDLRDGWGGADINYLNLLRKPIAEITSRNRKNEQQNFTGTWNKPVVLLTNERSTSGKELFAYGFKKLKLGKIVGQSTAGAVLAGRCFLLSNGDVLYLAVSDVRVDGQKLEGKGVSPDIRVDRVGGRSSKLDPQLEAAKSTLVDQLSAAKQ